MQMAKIRYSQNETSNWSTIELYTDILHNLAVVSELIQNNNDHSAHDLVVNMSALDADLDARRLLDALGTGSNAEPHIEALIKSYKWQLERLYEVHHSASRKILLVDDRPEVLETVSGFLRKDYKVFALTGGVAVLNFLSKQQPDLFIIDIQMPDMDGITLTQRIRAMPQYAKSPIMILTGNAEREMVVKAFKAGANDFLIKPANKETLLAKISSYLT
jgi:CheY-like chemotaxis protein